jgi:hypothetical protein
MKLKSMVTAISLIAASVMFVSAGPVQAGECSAADPCQTYAMLDNAGTVTNIIVCQPSVCGGGEWAGQRVVAQVAADPVTHQNQGGFLGTPDAPVKESGGNFTITNTAPVVNQTVINQTADVSVVLNARIDAGTRQSFNFNDTIGSNGSDFSKTIDTVDNNVGATISAVEYTVVSDTKTSVVEQTAKFDKRKTKQEVEDYLWFQSLDFLWFNWSWFLNWTWFDSWLR